MLKTKIVLCASLTATVLALGCERSDERTSVEAVDTPTDSIPAAGNGIAAGPLEYTAGQSFSYGCADEYRFVAQMMEDGESVRLLLPDTTLTVRRVDSASGARYGDGPYIYSPKEDEASIETPDMSFTGCVSDEGGRSWEEAKARGVRFRAVGQEPGWVLDIHASDSITVLADYGESRYGFPYAEPEEDPGVQTVFRIETDAHQATIVIENEPCRDGMSGWPYETSVSMTLDEREYRGCGRWL